jgi:Tfp pilus assembly protein PilZ
MVIILLKKPENARFTTAVVWTQPRKKAKMPLVQKDEQCRISEGFMEAVRKGGFFYIGTQKDIDIMRPRFTKDT